MSEILSRRCRLLDSCEQQAILLKKVDNFRPKLRFPCLPGDKFDTILSRCSRLSRTSRAPSRLIRPSTPDQLRCRARPSDEDFPGFWPIIFSKIVKKFFFRARHLVVIYAPREAHCRISFFAQQMLAKKKLFSGRRACVGFLWGVDQH